MYRRQFLQSLHVMGANIILPASKLNDGAFDVLRRKAVGHHHLGESFPLIVKSTGSLFPVKTDFCQILPNRPKMTHEHNEHLPT